jgi:[calcium/calmodulin-dependent protein kinase] kinase
VHSINIVHRDLKPQNILITEDETAKIIDFDRSVQLKTPDQLLAGSEGTYHFMAPEMLSEKQVGGYNGMLCDIWSLGVSLYSVVFGRLPFADELLVRLF